MAKKTNYVCSAVLEEWWYGWILTRDSYAWEQMSSMIYLICDGVATKFNPKSPEDHQEHVHDAWAQIMEKIKSGKLRFTHGKAPVFYLLTTTAFRILFSKMNKQKKQREHYKKYSFDFVQSKCPEMLPLLEHPQAMMADAASM
jgi:hypothetical protein